MGTVRTTMMVCLFAVSSCAAEATDSADTGTSDEEPASPLVELVISPVNPTVLVENGVSSPVAFEATAVYDDGRRELVAAQWSIDNPSLGAVDSGTGKFAASGTLAGIGKVTAFVGDDSATTDVTVRVETTIVGDGVPADGPDRFPDAPTADPTNAGTLLYPLNGAVVPTSLPSPTVQWEGGTDGDLFRVVIDSGLARLTFYRVHSGAGFDSAITAAGEQWSTIKRSSSDGSVRFVLDRWSAADQTAYRSAPVAISLANANLDGAIYYWDLGAGKMLRITESGREDFIPNPPASPETGSRCVACHTVSRDGRLLAAELWGGDKPSAIFDLTADLSADPAPTVVAPDKYTALFSTFNPDASRLLINRGTALSLIDPTTGDPIAAGGAGLPANGAAHPTWSPDGQTIAYVANTNGTWAVDYTVGDLATITVTGPDQFSAPTVIRIADGLANSWPTFSPDSNWVAFGRGANSRGRNDSIAEVYPGKLFLIPRTGGTPTELAALNGGQENSYLPNFSPFDEGGYYWLAFYSTRDYGNAAAGTKGTGRRQLWVAAIKNNPTPGEDPSAVPFWLPQQDVAADNMSAYWVVKPPVD